MVKNGHFWAKNGQNRPFLGIFGQIFFFFSRFLPSIAPRLKAPCPSGSRPPIYTVLNAAFSALNTLSGGTVVGHHSPAASHGLPEHSPPRVSTFPTSPPNYASRISPTTFFFIIKNFNLYLFKLFFIIINTKVFDATCKKYFLRLNSKFLHKLDLSIEALC